MSRKDKAESFLEEGYQVTVTGRHVNVTEAMKAYAVDKIMKLERFSPRLIDVIVTMDIQRINHSVDISLRWNSMKIKSHATTTDMYISIDQAVDKIQNQIRRYKRRIQEHHTKGLKSVDMKVNVFEPSHTDDLTEINDEIVESNQQSLIEKYKPHKLVAYDAIPLKRLTLDECIMKMELSGDAFLIYISEEDRKLKVMYRRKDGNFGVIEPEV